MLISLSAAGAAATVLRVLALLLCLWGSGGGGGEGKGVDNLLDSIGCRLRFCPDGDSALANMAGLNAFAGQKVWLWR